MNVASMYFQLSGHKAARASSSRRNWEFRPAHFSVPSTSGRSHSGSASARPGETSSWLYSCMRIGTYPPMMIVRSRSDTTGAPLKQSAAASPRHLARLRPPASLRCRHRRRNRRRQQNHPTPRAGKMASPTTFATRTTRREYIKTTHCIATHQRVRRPQAKVGEVSAFSTTTLPPTHVATTFRCTRDTGTTDTGK